MKNKILHISCFVITLLLFITGCSLSNTPTKKVETFLNNYRNLNESVQNQLNNIVAKDSTMTTTQKDKYKEVLKKQYQDMTYTIKDEIVDGDNATVKVEIEVYDLYKTNVESSTYYNTNPDDLKDLEGNMSESKYIDYRIEKLKDQTEKIKYTIDFTLKKINKTWVVDDLDDITRQKIHGLYAY